MTDGATYRLYSIVNNDFYYFLSLMNFYSFYDFNNIE